MPTKLHESFYTDSQDMLVLSSAIASCYCKYCTDGSTSPGNYGYPIVIKRRDNLLLLPLSF
jgi:hypothetical protein